MMSQEDIAEVEGILAEYFFKKGLGPMDLIGFLGHYLMDIAQAEGISEGYMDVILYGIKEGYTVRLEED